MIGLPLQLQIAAGLVSQPEAILVLGGGSNREAVAAELAHVEPTLEIWVSSGRLRSEALKIFRAAGIADYRVQLDYRATDTVTNFTTLIAEFQQRQIQHLYIVTSDYHMRRAKAIAAVVLGSRGIAFTPVAVPSTYTQESWLRALRDWGRAAIWQFTGHTGARLKRDLARLRRQLD
jgi:uncharacterized SAM-binding protein YcdF (DUF218 family)